jgi:EAL domain-containing protein (putative c-di-GMP-specific phosphodiesterase class I)
MLYAPALDTSSPLRVTLVGELRTALTETDQLVVHYQPKADVVTGEVVGVEALVRWQHPTAGMVGPDVFVPVAERSGLIRPLTTVVLRHALDAIVSLRDAGYPLGVAVNLSPRSLLDLEIVEEVAHLLGVQQLPPETLTLEITESSVMSDPDRSIQVLHQLRKLGVRLAVDDFGTGYSSLSYLRQLPVQEVKIDRSFVQHMVTEPDDATIVRSIIDLGANLDLAAVAEGVEDQETWTALAEMGCAQLQGYHLSRPLPLDKLHDWLSKRDAQRCAPLGALVPHPRAHLDASTSARRR